MAEAPDAQRLLAAMDTTWRAAERVMLGDWVIRRGLGGGQRVSSIWAKGEPGLPLDAALEHAVGIQRGWGEAPLVQVAPEATALDAALAERGWEMRDRSILMAAEIDRLAAVGTGGLMVVHVTTPLAVLDELWEAEGIGAARRAVIARTPEPKICLMLRADDRPAAAAFVGLDGTLAMLHALVVAKRFRRRGVGQATVAAAAQWAVRQRASHLGLAVGAHNQAAVALYRRMEFAEPGVYHYRQGA